MEKSTDELGEKRESLLEIEKIAGLGDESVACSVFAKKIVVDERIGTLILVVFLKNTGESDLQETQRNIFEIVTKKLEEAQTSTLEALRLSFEAGVLYLSGRDLEASLAAAFFWGGACYLARHGEKVKILVFSGQKSEEVEIEHGSGPARAGQTYVIATEAFLKIFDSSTILGQESLSEVRDELATEISSREDQGAIAAVLVRVREEEKSGGGKQDEVEVVAGEKEDLGQETGETEDEESDLNETGTRAARTVRSLRALTIGNSLAIFRLRRNIVTATFLILVILSVSVFGAISQKSNDEKKVKYEAHMTQAKSLYNEGAAIANLNRLRAREILVEGEGEVKMALALFENDEKAANLASQIAAKLKETEAKGEVKFETLAEVDDSLNSLAIWEKGLFGISSGKIFEVDLAASGTSDLGIEDNTKSGFVFEAAAYLLGQNGVSRVNLAVGNQKKLFSFSSSGHDIAVFLGNIYLLGARQIAKFVPIEGGYSEAGNYLEEEADFSSKSRFAIDGSIWVTSGKKIYKFTRGANDNFEISGLAEVGEFGPVYTNSDLDNLYVVDVSNSAMLVIGKDGMYRRAYQSPEFGRASDLVVSESGKKVYISSANKILEAEIE